MSDAKQATELPADAPEPSPPTPPATRRRWLPYVILLVVFAAGGATGAGVMRAQMHQQWRDGLGSGGVKGRTDARMRSMTRRLDLSEEQREKVKQILETSEQQRRDAVAPCREALEASKAQVEGQLAAVLSVDQLERYKSTRRRGRGDRGRRGGRGRGDKRRP